MEVSVKIYPSRERMNTDNLINTDEEVPICTWHGGRVVRFCLLRISADVSCRDHTRLYGKI